MEKNILFMVIIVAMLSLFITSCSSNEEGTIIELNQSSDDIDMDKEAEDIITEMSEEISPFDLSVANALANENRKQWNSWR